MSGSREREKGSEESTKEEKIAYYKGLLVGVGEGAQMALDGFCRYDPALDQFGSSGGSSRRIRDVAKVVGEIIDERTQWMDEELAALCSSGSENEEIEG